VAAAKLLGIKEVPTVRLAHLSEAEKRAYILADNRLAEKAGWDREILAIELQALVDLDFEVELTGFETAEVDLILEEANEAVGTGGCEDEIPTYGAGPAVTRPGDLWNLGPHRLLCARMPETPLRMAGFWMASRPSSCSPTRPTTSRSTATSVDSAGSDTATLPWAAAR